MSYRPVNNSNNTATRLIKKNNNINNITNSYNNTNSIRTGADGLGAGSAC